MSVVNTKIAISTTVEINDVSIKVAVSLQRNGLSSQYFPQTCKRTCCYEIRKNLEKYCTDLYYISAYTITYSDT